MGALDRAMFAHFRDPAKLKQITALLEKNTVGWQWPILLQMHGNPIQWADSLKRFKEEKSELPDHRNRGLQRDAILRRG